MTTNAAGGSPEPLTIWAGTKRYMFPVGVDVSVGRGRDADVPVIAEHHRTISRQHLLVRNDGAQWRAHDRSRNGIYVGGRRVSTVAIDDGTALTLGTPDGPLLTFRVEPRPVPAARHQVPPHWSPLPAPPQPEPAVRSTPPGRHHGHVAPLVKAASAVVLIGAAAAAVFVMTDGEGSPQSQVPGPPTEPTPSQTVDPDQLDDLLLAPSALASVLDAPQFEAMDPPRANMLSTIRGKPPTCTGIIEPGTAEAYRNTASRGVAGQTFADPADPATSVVQYVVALDSADDAIRYREQQLAAWRDCASTAGSVQAPSVLARPFTIGEVDSTQNRLSTTLTTIRGRCQRVLSTAASVVIDVRVCAPLLGQQAEVVALQIEDEIT
ncbi:sensor domain-containing protein [Mycolicibacterium sp. 3033]|nr:sensor domain-containing protein [Mycolicibacterium aurantiacum]